MIIIFFNEKKEEKKKRKKEDKLKKKRYTEVLRTAENNAVQRADKYIKPTFSSFIVLLLFLGGNLPCRPLQTVERTPTLFGPESDFG